MNNEFKSIAEMISVDQAYDIALSHCIQTIKMLIELGDEKAFDTAVEIMRPYFESISEASIAAYQVSHALKNGISPPPSC